MPQPKLTRDDRRDLMPIIAGLYFFSGGERGRQVLIQQAGLDFILPGFELSGPSGIVAGDLITRLEKKGKLDDEPKYYALGALLGYILTMGELPQEEAHIIANVIVKYSLIDDAAYIARLRSKYAILVWPNSQSWRRNHLHLAEGSSQVRRLSSSTERCLTRLPRM
jgi:hypothetical protein